MSTDIDDDGVFSVDGEPIGQVHQADDGNLLLVAFDGRILDATTPDGGVVDPADYMPAPEPPSQDFVTRSEFELSQRLAALEAQVAPQQAQEPQFDPEQAAAAIEARLGGIAHDLGRELTSQELDSIFRECGAQLDAGRDMDFEMAAMNAGLTHADNMTRQERVAWGTQRLNDADNEERQPREHYDLDTHEGRTAFMDDRLNGRIDDEQAAAIKSGEQPETAEPAAPEAA